MAVMSSLFLKKETLPEPEPFLYIPFIHYLLTTPLSDVTHLNNSNTGAKGLPRLLQSDSQLRMRKPIVRKTYRLPSGLAVSTRLAEDRCRHAAEETPSKPHSETLHLPSLPQPPSTQSWSLSNGVAGWLSGLHTDITVMARSHLHFNSRERETERQSERDRVREVVSKNVK